MPKVSKKSAPTHMKIPGVVDSYMQEEGGWTVSLDSYFQDGDAAFLFKGGKNDQCQATHMGYVIKGKMGVRMADGSEIVSEAGEAYVIPPGHTPILFAGSEIVDFTRTEEVERESAVETPNFKKYLEDQGIEIPPEMQPLFGGAGG